MPATFAHCLLAQKGIDRLSKLVRKDEPQWEKRTVYAGRIGERNKFVIMGAAGLTIPT